MTLATGQEDGNNGGDGGGEDDNDDDDDDDNCYDHQNIFLFKPTSNYNW